MRKAVNILLLLCTMALQSYAQDADRSRRYDAFFLDAICQQEKGNNDAAFDLFRHCLEIDSVTLLTEGSRTGTRQRDLFGNAG